MTKKHFTGLALIVAGILFSASFASAAATPQKATTTPAKKITDQAIVKFVKTWDEAKADNDQLTKLVQDAEKQMNALNSLPAEDYGGKLKAINTAIAKVNSSLALINKQNTRLALLKKTAGTIKDAKTRASGQKLAGYYVDSYKILQHMVKTEKDVLVMVKDALTQQSKNRPVAADLPAKLESFGKLISADNDKLVSLGKTADAAQAAFEKLAGVKLAK